MKLCDATSTTRVRQEDDEWWYYVSATRRTRAVLYSCELCGEPSAAMKQSRGAPSRFCSAQCRARWQFSLPRPDRRGVFSDRWKGGVIRTRRGYLLELAPGHPDLAGTTRRYVLQHRLVMERKLGRPLSSTEWVHHLNGRPDDNRPENLELRVRAHGPGASRPHCDTCVCFAGVT